MPSAIRFVHRFAERYGWTPEITLGLTDELRDGLLACMRADGDQSQAPDTRELEWTAEAIRELENDTHATSHS